MTPSEHQERPRRLHLIPRFGRGGAEQTILDLARAFPDVETIVGSAGGDGLPALTRAGVPWVPVPLLPSSPGNAVRSFQVIRQLVRDRPIELIHSHHRFSSLVGHAVSRWTGVPLVCTVHDLATGHQFLSRLAFSGNVQVTVFSDAVRAHVVQHFGMENNRIHKIAMGIPPVSRPTPAEVTDIRRQAECGTHEIVVGFCGRLVAEKGPDLLLQAAVTVLSRNPMARFWIIGDGELRPELESRMRELGISSRVTFFGWRNDSQQLLGAADLVVVSSRREGLCRVAVEGLLLGKPVIATRVGSLPELIRQGDNGLLIPPDNVAALAEAISLLIESEELRHGMGHRALVGIEHQFSLEAMGLDFEAIYRSSLVISRRS